MSGCSLSEPPAPAFEIGVTQPTTHLDPAIGDEPGTLLVGRAAFQTLPQLATHVSRSTEGRTWTFAIAPGLRFADGTPLDATAIVTNFARWARGPFGTDGFAAYARTWANPRFPGRRIARVSASDPLHVQVVTRDSVPTLRDALADAHFGIGSPAAFRRGNAAFDATPVGSGPYAVSAWQRGDAVVLLPNPRNGTADFASEVVREVPDPGTTILALEKNDLSVVYGLPQQLVQDAAAQALRTRRDMATGRVCAFSPRLRVTSLTCPP